jgi:hypothetical protein
VLNVYGVEFVDVVQFHCHAYTFGVDVSVKLNAPFGKYVNVLFTVNDAVGNDAGFVTVIVCVVVL